MALVEHRLKIALLLFLALAYALKKATKSHKGIFNLIHTVTGNHIIAYNLFGLSK
jgi:hypothetical protein